MRALLEERFMIFRDVPMDRVLTKGELKDILALSIKDVPGADVYARREGQLSRALDLVTLEIKTRNEKIRCKFNY